MKNLEIEIVFIIYISFIFFFTIATHINIMKQTKFNLTYFSNIN